MKKKLLIAMLALAVSVCASGLVFAQDETMTNTEVISLSKAGLSSAIIIDKIRTSKTNFDMSTDSLDQIETGGHY